MTLNLWLPSSSLRTPASWRRLTLTADTGTRSTMPAKDRESQEIENEEWHHRQLVGEMLRSLDSRPNAFRETRAAILGRVLSLLCHLSGWLAPMYGAGKLESRNIVEYETAARYARNCGRDDLVDCLLTMAEVEWEHEHYFRARVLGHRWAKRLPIWPQPPAKETIRKSFAQDFPVERTGQSLEPALDEVEIRL